jgi:hypothetical protein
MALGWFRQRRDGSRGTLGSSTYAVPRYAASADTVATLRQLEAQPIHVGAFVDKRSVQGRSRTARPRVTRRRSLAASTRRLKPTAGRSARASREPRCRRTPRARSPPAATAPARRIACGSSDDPSLRTRRAVHLPERGGGGAPCGPLAPRRRPWLGRVGTPTARCEGDARTPLRYVDGALCPRGRKRSASGPRCGL